MNCNPKVGDARISDAPASQKTSRSAQPRFTARTPVPTLAECEEMRDAFEQESGFDQNVESHYLQTQVIEAAKAFNLASEDGPAYVAPPLRPADILGNLPDSQPSSENEVQRSHEIPVRSLAARRIQNPHPAHREVLINGLVRRGEVMNIVSGTKIGKSWLVMDLILSVAAGKPWIGLNTTKGKVLLLECKLHDETIDARLTRIATEKGINIASVEGNIKIAGLRGTGSDITSIESLCDSFEAGEFSLIVLNPMYLLFPKGKSEANDCDVRDLYLRLDRIAGHTGAALVVGHHASKGYQSGKTTADIGSGHGVLSRSPDTHLVLLREPNTRGSVPRLKVQAVTRTFPQPADRYLARASVGGVVWQHHLPPKKRDHRDVD